MVKRKGSKKQRGGEFSGRPMSGGYLAALSPGQFNPEGAPPVPSQYKTINGGSRKKRSHKRRRSHRTKKGGDGVLATAAVPFGLLALQRYFKGSKTSKQGVARIGKSVRRTFRRRR